MIKNLRSILSWPSMTRSHRNRAEHIGRLARRSKLRRTLNLESLESRRVFAGLVINELVSDPNGTDQPNEYVELKGTPGATLSNIYLVSIEGDSAVQGLADIVVNLTGQVLGSNGLLVIKADTGGPTILEGATTIIGSPDITAGSVFENGSNSFAIISSPTDIAPATDLDPDNDGDLDLPVGATLVDAIGWRDGGTLDIAYGAILTQVAGSPPGAATRFPHDNRPNTVDAWYSGDLAAPNSSLFYSATPANLSANFPVGGQLTPGGFNVPGDANAAPVGVADNYQVEPNGTLITNVGTGVLANDTDANGSTSLLSAVLISAPPTNALSFVFNDDGSFTYVNNGTPGIDTFTYQATDLNLISSTTTVSINVAVSTNIGPTISVPAGPIGYTENGSPLVLASTATLSDSDSADFASGSVAVDISVNADPADRLEIRDEGNGLGQIGVLGNVIQFGGITIGTASGGDGANPLVVDLNSNATPAAAQALLRNITYRNLSDNPSGLARSVRFVVTDGDGGPSGGVSNIVSTTVNFTLVNDAPTLTNSRTSFSYAANGPAVTLDGFLAISDADSLDLNSGILTATISAGAVTGDSLTVRNTGNAAGQVGVAGNIVSFGGTAIGSLAGGSGGLPLTIAFNASSTPEASQAVARAIVFATTSNRLVPAPRTISVVLTDGDGGTSNTLDYTVQQSQVRRFGFQEGVDNGQGPYTGAADVQLAENQPNTHLPEGANPTTEGLLVDFDGGTANSQVLLRFDNIFGGGQDQIPLGATIVSARLVVNTLNGGDGAQLHRMLTSWDANTETWNTFGNGVAPRNASPAVQNDDVEARSAFDSQIGVEAGNSDPTTNPTIIGVTADVQAWASGASNLGWMMQGWAARTDGWAFLASEGANPAQRPKLEIEWLPSTIAGASFRQGENGYTGNVDTALSENTPVVNNSTATTMFVDFNDAAATNTSQVLLRFDDVNGSLAGQVPAGALVHSAALSLASTVSNAQGDGGQFHTLLQPFDGPTATWDTFGVGAPGSGGGVTADGVEASLTANTIAGNASLTPDAQGGYSTFDVTQDVQAWTAGSLSNNGWAILPWTNGTNGWAIESSESTLVQNRPQLRVFFTPVGVTVAPTTGLTTTELGGTANFSVALNTPPTANVTIGLSSSNANEGTPSTSSLIFTPANWDIPQVVTVTGINDLVADGDVLYQIITGAAVSTDPNYNGLNPDDVSLTNTGNGPSGVAVVNRQIFYNRSTSAVFGNGTGNPANAIDSTKSVLLPGQTSTFANYSNYSRGLNGLIVDVAGLVTATAADFQFATWNGIDAAGFVASAATPTVSVLPGDGVSGSSRVKIEFPDNAIRNTWLRVTVLANANTALSANDVFYFGSAVADFNTGNLAGPPVTVRINATDTSAVRQNQSPSANSVGITNVYDVNKDGRVNATDTSAVRQNQANNVLRYFTAPASLVLAGIMPTVDVPAIEFQSGSESDNEGLLVTEQPFVNDRSDLRPETSAPSSATEIRSGRAQLDVDPESGSAEANEALASIDRFFAEFSQGF